MFSNYLKVFLYNCFKQRLYTFINVLGLSIGLACCLIIMLFIRHELSYDRFFKNSENIYRVSLSLGPPAGDRFYFAWNSAPAGPLLLQEYEQIQNVARLGERRVVLNRNDLTFSEDEFNLIDPSFFEIFDFRWIQGNPETALNNPNSVVLTQSLASKYFGNEDPMGQTLEANNQYPLQVTGVIEDLPENTHFTGTAFVSVELFEELTVPLVYQIDEWGGGGFHTYLQLEPGADPAELEAQFPSFMDRFFDFPTTVAVGEMRLTALTDIHIGGERNAVEIARMKPAGNLNVIYIFSAIAAAILLIACINFMNLSTARSTRRAGEVGLRKSLGAGRKLLAMQFIAESIALCTISMLVALVFVELLLPPVSTLLDIEFTSNYFSDPVVLMLMGGMVLVVGLGAGWYPALYLSAFQPLEVMKGNINRKYGGNSLRSTLVVLQFSISIILLVASVYIYNQMKYASELELGFDEAQTVVVNTTGLNFTQQYQAFKNELLSSPDISNVTSSSSTPLLYFSEWLMPVNAQDSPVEQNMSRIEVDFDFFDTFDIELLAGRYFDEALSTDKKDLPFGNQSSTGRLIINESAARNFGWTPEEALGKWVDEFANSHIYTVVGVVGDTISTAKTAARPLVYSIPSPEMGGSIISVKVDGDIPAALEHIDASWAAILPNEPIRRSFLDSNFEAIYLQENRQMQLAFWFAGLSILIACMGLFGLATFNTETRTKEIGVRKVMGGSVWSIVLLLTNDFSKLVLISNLIAWPVAYFAMNRWLENFAYRIDLTPIIFIGSGLIALCIAWVTVGGTAAKAASAKPVLALRYE